MKSNFYSTVKYIDQKKIRKKEEQMNKELYDEIIERAVKTYVTDSYYYRSGGYYADTIVAFYNQDTKRVEIVHSAKNLDEFKRTKTGAEYATDVKFKDGTSVIVRSHNYYRSEQVIYLKQTIELFEKDFPYSGIKTFMSTAGSDQHSVFLYMNLYIKNQNLEKIAKIGPKLAYSGVYDYETFNRCFKKNKNSMKDICQMPDWLWKKLVKENVSLKTWNFIRIWYRQSLKDETSLAEEDINALISMSQNGSEKTLTSFKYIIRNATDENGKKLFTITKLNRYLDRIDMYQAIDRYTGIEILRDYINMCKDLEIVPVTDSNSLKREHDVTARVHRDFARRKWEEKNAEKQAKQEEKFKEIYPQLEKFTYENDELQVVVPHSPKDMFDEARMNHNCLSSYVDNFAKGISKIFFIRRKEQPDKSYITVELNSTLCDYRQAYYAGNQPVTKKSDLTFIKNWLENNKKLRLQNA